MKMLSKIQAALFGAAIVSASVSAQTPVNPNATPEARALLKAVYAQSGKNTIWSGQHCYPLYSDILMERVENFTGQHPVVFGQDFGYSKRGSLDGINFRQRTVENALVWHAKGAIITLMWHAVPPVTKDEYTVWQNTPSAIQSKLTDKQWNDLLTEGTEINNRWKSQVDVIAFFLKQLQDQNVPVIWRPYHEMNGDWFWWCNRPGENGYKKLYRMLYDRLTNYHGLNNLLWVFNANEVGSPNVKEYKLFYPGDDVVDILATDVYNHNYSQENYDQLSALAGSKPIALGEVGKMPTPKILEQQPKWTWFMCWAEFLETANTWVERDELYKSPLVITLEEYLKK